MDLGYVLGTTADDLLDATVLFSYTRIGHALRRPWWDDIDRSLAGVTCVVTGANAGLGKALSRRLAGWGATVYLVCRDRARGETARAELAAATGNDRLFLEVIDLSSQAAIRAGAARLLDRIARLDVLVNNASVLLDERRLSVDGIEMTFATNVLGYFLLTTLLYPALHAAEAPRVLNVSSAGMYLARLHVDDLQHERRPYDGVRAYAETKRAEVILAQRWAVAWGDAGIRVHAAHPGWAATPGVRSSLPRFYRGLRPLLRTPAQGADGIAWLAADPRVDDYPNGLFWFDRRPRRVHKRLGATPNTDEEIDRFWEACHRLTRRET